MSSYTLHHGRVQDVLPVLVVGGFRADLIVTDPPYRLTSGGPSGLMRGIFAKENYNNDGGIVECDIDWPEIMELLFAALADQGHCYTMANNRNVQAMLNAAEAAGFGFHNLLVWDKVSAVTNRWYMKNLEFVGFFYKGNARRINNCSAKQLIRYPHQDESDHPTEKPVALMRHYIENSSKPGDIVLDPFAGSGSTGVAAIKSGRRFVGIEKMEAHYLTAVARLKAAESEALQDELFRA